MKKIEEILLLPKQIFIKLSNKKISLFYGVFLIAILITFDNYNQITRILLNVFVNKKIYLIFSSILLMALLKTFLFNIPIYEYIISIKKAQNNPLKIEMFIKQIKIFIISQVVVIPLLIPFVFIKNKFISDDNYISTSEYIVILAIAIIIHFWSSAIFTRGIVAVANLKSEEGEKIFIICFCWGWLVNQAIDFMAKLTIS